MIMKVGEGKASPWGRRLQNSGKKEGHRCSQDRQEAGDQRKRPPSLPGHFGSWSPKTVPNVSIPGIIPCVNGRQRFILNFR